ncbi:MAG TPA: selenide, water dikinase SelD [Spirochaetia bacterium]|nr:selenide, water dikinase SelD [Spirochaetia bacterium]
MGRKKNGCPEEEKACCSHASDDTDRAEGGSSKAPGAGDLGATIWYYFSMGAGLTSFSRFAGCGAKLGAGLLDKALCGLSQRAYPDLIADFRHSEDAGVLRLNESQALIHTVDFFPPIVDDPFLFGRIAAVNALSDVYAMGGKPSTAVCIVGFPTDSLDVEVLQRMMEGGLSALQEADCPLVGGHTVEDGELKFGYAVTGLVDPNRVWLNNSLKGEERLILTKPIGTGLVTTAEKAGLASPEALAAAIESMRTLNRTASEILAGSRVNACTDVTGFGLLGHACEMAADSPCSLHLSARSVPLLPSALDYAAMGMVPEGTYRTRTFRMPFIINHAAVDDDLMNVLFDPQTSGGLLAAVDSAQADQLVEKLRSAGVSANVVGETVPGKGMVELV